MLSAGDDAGAWNIVLGGVSNYRPICDLWWMARAKLKEGKKLYGAFPGGFLERARALLGCRLDEPVLHVCGGAVRYYPYKRGFGPHDKTLDLDPEFKPDFLHDAREPFPLARGYKRHDFLPLGSFPPAALWPGIIIDGPYSELDAAKYRVGAEVYPKPGLLVKNAFEVLPSGGRIGILHYTVPSPPKNAVFVASICVLVGYNNRSRIYSVFERS